jgi:WhiB family transcriptional regulator, redox-sensing transcriptional regulator
MDWRDRGACVGEDPDLFFPIGDGRLAATQTAAAKAICHRCPVLRPCLDWALTAGPEGVWGGLDDSERKRIERATRGPQPVGRPRSRAPRVRKARKWEVA